MALGANVTGLRLPLILFFVLALTFEGLSSPSWSAPRTFHLAFLGSLSGDSEALGRDQLKSTQFAVDKFNQSNKGKIRIRLQVFDDAGLFENATQMAKQIASDTRILGVVGPSLSTSAIAVIPVLGESKIPMISPSAVREVLTPETNAEASAWLRNFHRVVGTDREQAQALVDLATHEVPSPKLLIVHHDGPYSMGLANRMRQLTNTQNAHYELVSEKTSNWSFLIEKISKEGFNSLVYLGYFPQASVLVKQLTDFGFKGVITLSDGSLSPSFLMGNAKGSLEGIRLTGLTMPLDLANRRLFFDIYGKGASGVGLYAAEAFDATTIFLECIKRGSQSRRGLNVCLNRYSGKSITGREIRFDSSGDLLGDSIARFEVRDGKFELFRR